MGKVCRIQGHPGHPSGGVLPSQGIVGCSSSVKLCKGRKEGDVSVECMQQRQGEGRASETQPSPQEGSKGRESSDDMMSNRPSADISLDSTSSDYGVSHTCWAKR